ncbi:FAD-binding protein [Mycobacterium paragordonae]|uniref:FAD-binding protein n=1 Tax=Mycobacterium paragordonae TaxID=1389713 RepID=A0A4V6PMW6_9MYCO|nr:FAD-binding protein [Mycobacterium paragordonae]MDP7737767.1 FAD-binding protein [Mycobacterium paragordonae]TDK98444.1 FAD-binding protein [Mycobacterium paragordonae]TDL02303.1 FAD-binding protein [Mycobacterium paragordonae]TDL12901.1 FAD-binding protein [Mycobacterium paragordonae]
MSTVESTNFTESADVVVVGFGAAGTCAAIAARENGADVLALDRANGGGSTAVSGGIIYAGGGTWVQQQAGVSDSYEQMLTYLRREVGDAVSPQTLESFVAGSPEMIRWLSDYGVPFDSTVCPYKTSYPNNHYYLYHSGSENAGEFRALTPPVQRGHRVKGKGTSGKKMYEPLAKSAVALGARFSPHTVVSKLIQDADGRVIGVEATTMRHAPPRIQQRYSRLAGLSTKPGIYYPPLRAQVERQLRRLERRYARPVRIQARRGVIICAGGYMANTEWVKRFAPQYLGGLQLGTSGDDGSGIAMAQSAGAVTERMDNVSAWRFITPPSAFISAIIVDEQGKRIIDESRYGAAVGYQMVRHHHGKGWLLADATLIKEARRQMIKQPLWFQRAQSAALMFLDSVKGASLPEVAQRAGIDPDGLVATVQAHNNAIDTGTADPAGKPADFTRRISKPPFTLLNISIRPNLLNPTPMLTLGGIRVDETTGAVLDSAGSPIPGLYSAGRTATGICSNSYVSGLSLADCVYAGRRAGKHAAADQPADR